MRELQEWKSTETRTIKSMSLEYAAMKNLIFRGSASLDYQDFVDDQYQKPGFRTDQPETGFAYRNPFYSRNWNGNLTAVSNGEDLYIWTWKPLYRISSLTYLREKR